MENAALRVYSNLRAFFESRKLRPVAAPRSHSAAGSTSGSSGLDAEKEAFLRELGYFGSYRVEGAAEDGMKVVVVLLSSQGKLVESGPALSSHLTPIWAEKASREGEVAEVLAIAPEEVWGKKNLLDALGPLLAPPPGAPVLKIYPYHAFIIVIPQAACVPAHEIVSAEEEAALYAADRLHGKDALGRISATDPPIIWIGGQPGQLVRIRSPSETAGEAITYRRVE